MSEYYGGSIAWIKTGELNNNYINKSEETITEKALQECSLRLTHIGDILIAMYGATIGELGIANINLTTNQACCACTPYAGIYNLYLFYFLRAEKTRLIKLGMGGAQPNISKEKIINYIIPIPPFTEQQRIVERIEELLVHINTIDSNQAALEHLYDNLKKKTLDLAIRGKLVSQDPNDEPASELLKRIRAEKKAKLGQKYVDSYIYKGDDNCYYEHIDGNAQDEPIDIPFDISDNWCWARIQNISESYIGLTYKPIDIVKEGGNIVLRSSNIQDGKLDLTDIVRVNTSISEKLHVYQNDIIICVRNGSKKLVGKSAIVDIDLPNLTFGAFMAICKTPFYDYVSQYLQSQLFFGQLLKVSGTTTINQLTQASFNKFLIPIPPLAEQQRIVDKLNEIFAKL